MAGIESIIPPTVVRGLGSGIVNQDVGLLIFLDETTRAPMSRGRRTSCCYRTKSASTDKCESDLLRPMAPTSSDTVTYGASCKSKDVKPEGEELVR